MSTCTITWNENKPTIQTDRLIFRPINASDLKSYQTLFGNELAMGKFLGGVKTPEQTEIRFRAWLQRWEVHPFSALAIFRKAEVSGLNAIENLTSDFVGHVILGHGDYEGIDAPGWSMGAMVIDPRYWQGGSANCSGIGTEVVKAVHAYAKELFHKGVYVPVDVAEGQREEVEEYILKGRITKVIRNEDKQITAVFVPFTEIRATTLNDNIAMLKILRKEGSGKSREIPCPGDDNRTMFIYTQDF